MNIVENRNVLFKQFNKDLIIAEIGVFKGEFSKFLFEELKPKELHLIDIFEGMMCSGDKDGNNIVWSNLNDDYVNLKEYFKLNQNVYIHKNRSEDILNSFPNEYFDLIYIDGDHTYNGVKTDLLLSYNKVKKDGFICGHDYINSRFEGVVRAVNEFCEQTQLEINYITNDGCPSFCIRKK
jgi:hypothetical protein